MWEDRVFRISRQKGGVNPRGKDRYLIKGKLKLEPMTYLFLSNQMENEEMMS